MFRTGEALALCGVSEDAYRHWKSVLSPLAGRDGRGAGFTFSDLVTLAIFQTLKDLGISVSRLAPNAPEIFEFIADHVQTSGGPACIYIGQDISFGALRDAPDAEATVIVRADLIAHRVRDAVNRQPQREANDPQLRLL